MTTIGANIKNARKAAGIKTQGALAKTLGVPQPQLSDWENDRYDVLDLKTLMKVATAIPCTFDALVEGVDPQYDASRDLIRHGHMGQQTPPPQGESDVSAQTRIRELEGRVAAYQAIVGKLKELCEQVALVAGDSDKGGETVRDKSRRRGRH